MTNALVKESSATKTTPHYVSSTYLVMLQRYLEQLQPDPSAKNSNANPSGLENIVDISAIIPVMSAISDKLRHDCFGLAIGRGMHPSDYGIFGYALMNCLTITAALKTAAKYKTFLNHKLSAEFLAEHDRYLYQLNPQTQSKVTQILIELDFSTALEFGRQLAGPNHRDKIQLCSVKFTHSPLGPIHLYESRFNCPISFNAPVNEIAIAKSALDTPIYGANQRVLSVMEEKIEKMACAQSTAKVPLKDQVASYIRNNMLWELPSASKVATGFNMSLSSFKKHLSTEQTCYQKICDDVRLARGIELLKSKKIAIKEISYELGFANSSAFNKAFKRWTGQSPTEFKNEERKFFASSSV